jgi:hypothetical protein
MSRLEDGQLFAAPAYAGAFTPGCVVAVDGQDVAAGAATAAGGLMTVDGVQVTWGRDEVLDHPTPGTGRMVLFDPSRTWATGSDRRGLPVTIRYEGVSNLTGAPVSAVFFRGRISGQLTVSPRTLWVAGKRVRGTLIEVPLQSAVVDLANVTPREAWPAETLGARLDRVVAQARRFGMLAGGANVRDYWKVPNVAPVAAKDQVSLLDHITGLFDSAGADNYTYRPDLDSIVYLPRRNTSLQSMGRLDRTGTGPRGGQGAYIRARTVAYAAPDTEVATGQFLDTGTLEYDPSEGITTPARITRVALSHPDEGNAYGTRTVELPVVREPWDPAGGHLALDELRLGVRTARVDSQVAWNNFADVALSDTAELVRREGSRWLLAPFRLTTRKAGGFHSVAAAQTLLAGYERNDYVFLQRSWLPSLGVRPVVGIMGGTIRFERGGWDLELTPAPITTNVAQHSLSWEDLYDPDPANVLKWWDGPHPEGLDPTVTYEDMRYVGAGLLGADPPPSIRDEYQT